ncbi:MAG TPA: hemolysin III family protein [Holophagaceae bacterium]|nr:hemolysin III family protein [Holophagaceae bacterium]
MASEQSQDRNQELWNAITHGLGTALSIAALSVMVTFAALRGTARHIVGASLFGAMLVLLYLMSTLYHALRPPRAKKVFRILDHSAIFLLIAGTYTPLCLGPLKGAWGWSLFGIVWGLAVLGIVFKATLFHRLSWLSTAVYLLMGWIALIAIVPLMRTLSVGGLLWLFGGGLCYSGGVIFYRWQSLRHHHALWHLCVLAGSACHVFCVLFHVIPKPGA